MYPDVWQMARYFRSWVDEIWGYVDQYRAFQCWQTPEGPTTAAMVEDGDRPEKKPRPPREVHFQNNPKPELVQILAAVGLVSQ